MTRETAALESTSIDRALGIISILADEIGARRPTSRAERIAAEVTRDAFASAGIEAATEQFDGYASFGYPFGAITALATAPALVSRRHRGVRAALAALGAALLSGEGGLVHTPLSDRLSRRGSQNLVATLEPRGAASRTLCLVAHLDSSRSGLMFHPALAGQLNRLIILHALATMLLPAEPLLARTTAGRALLGTARAICAAGLGLLIERELRGVDVPGANDNASGVGAVLELAAQAAADPLESTRIVVLITGCEESGLLGAKAFVRRHDTSGWLFLNFDSVGSTATLRYTRAEGMVRKWACDPALVALAEDVAQARPELGLEPSEGPIGLTYDATVALARGGRALTFVAGDRGRIPNYHQPTDTVANLDPRTLARAVAAGREMIARIDRGEAD